MFELLREIRDALPALLTEQRAIRSELRRQTVAKPLADQLLRAIHVVIGEDAFTAADLVALADSPLSTRLELRAVVDDVVRCALDDKGAVRRLGRFLAANTQREVSGLQLVSLG